MCQIPVHMDAGFEPPVYSGAAAFALHFPLITAEPALIAIWVARLGGGHAYSCFAFDRGFRHR